jgi:2-C-methyl-D-erythritol 4-phosphate cytidylyltransferase
MPTLSGNHQPITSSAPANPTAGALLVATAPAPATFAAEALLWRSLRGKPVAAWALDALANKGSPGLESPQIAAVVIVARAERRAERRAEAEAMASGAPVALHARVVVSTPDWRASLAAGLAALPDACDWVIAVDAARPLVTSVMLTAAYAAARAMDGVALAGEPVTDTLKRVVNGRVVETPPRSALRRLTAPLVIRRDLLTRALQSPPAAPDAAGLAAIALASGARVATYQPGTPNPAITSEADWPVVEALLAARAVSG